jgi:hypothetical protein
MTNATQWPRPISSLPHKNDHAALAAAELERSDHILAWDESEEAWCRLCLAQWSLAQVHAAGRFTWWLPGPPARVN